MAKEVRIQMPDGDTLRIASQRRYIVVVKGPTSPWRIEYRSDTESYALARWRSEARVCEAAHLIDRTERKVIR